MVLGAKNSGEPWLGGSGLGSRAVAVRQPRLEQWGPGARGWPGGSLESHRGSSCGFSTCCSSLQQGRLRAVVAPFTSRLGLQAWVFTTQKLEDDALFWLRSDRGQSCYSALIRAVTRLSPFQGEGTGRWTPPRSGGMTESHCNGARGWESLLRPVLETIIRFTF